MSVWSEGQVCVSRRPLGCCFHSSGVLSQVSELQSVGSTAANLSPAHLLEHTLLQHLHTQAWNRLRGGLWVFNQMQMAVFCWVRIVFSGCVQIKLCQFHALWRTYSKESCRQAEVWGRKEVKRIQCQSIMQNIYTEPVKCLDTTSNSTSRTKIWLWNNMSVILRHKGELFWSSYCKNTVLLNVHQAS